MRRVIGSWCGRPVWRRDRLGDYVAVRAQGGWEMSRRTYRMLSAAHHLPRCSAEIGEVVNLRDMIRAVVDPIGTDACVDDALRILNGSIDLPADFVQAQIVDVRRGIDRERLRLEEAEQILGTAETILGFRC